MRRFLCFIALTALLSNAAPSQGKFSGYMFGDYFYNFARDTAIGSLANVANGGAKSFNGFQLRRIYFTYDNDISDRFTARFRLEADQAAQTSNGKIGVFVKDAYLKWKSIFHGSDLIFGISPTPAFDVSEATWGYRSLEKTILDLRGIVSSRDIGLALKGRFDERGIFGYWVMIANGSGNSPEVDKYKRYYIQFHIKPAENFQLTLYGDYNDRPRIIDPYSGSVPQQLVSNGAFTTSGFAGWNDGMFSAGVEGFLRSMAHGFNDGTALKSRNTIGVSVWATVSLQTQLALVGRFDYFDPNSSSAAKGDSRNLIIAALDWKVDENVSVMPNIVVETYETAPGGRSIDPSVTGRVTFYFVFLPSK